MALPSTVQSMKREPESPMALDTSSPVPASPPPGFHKAGTTSTAYHLYAGFVSGITSSVLLQPLDLLKTRVQQAKGSTIRASLRDLPSVGALWRGTVPSALRMSTGSALYFTCLSTVRGRIQAAKSWSTPGETTGTSSNLPKLNMYENLASGAFVRGFVGFLTMPITVVKVRFESSLYHYKSLTDAVTSVYKAHGFRGYFYGYGVTCARDAPYAGLYVLFYEKSKEILNSLFPSVSDNRSTVEAAVINSTSAAFSAAAATTITGPFDTIKTRVQLDPGKYRTFFHAVGLISREEGLLRFFDGLSLRLSRKALSAGISWCIYEEIVRRLADRTTTKTYL